jgi:hypothetical protein
MISRRLLVAGDDPDARLFTGPRGGRITTAVLRDATHWDEVVRALGYDRLRRRPGHHTCTARSHRWPLPADVFRRAPRVGHQLSRSATWRRIGRFAGWTM